MKKLIVIFLLLGWIMKGQEIYIRNDSIKLLDEVLVKKNIKKKIQTKMKMNVSIDEFLASSDQISFIKRGAYAWEPLLNNMGTERSTITIDGMHIFGACTDKMDPVTSYLESNNLASIDIKSGQEGGMHGSTVAGSIDLKRKNTSFGRLQKLQGVYQSGFEFNNKQFFNLGNFSFSSNKFVADGSISYRKAKDYYDGKGNEVKHSQFKKINVSLGVAYKTGELSSIRLDAIFDKAKDVGYPALTMDLWLSRAVITSATYKQLYKKGIIKAWDTKIYFNAIEHYMDDTKRPENLVHMDMPGWSTTYGLLSKLTIKQGNISSEIQLNAYNNLSTAEMRMYPQDRSKQTMFAYSWPCITSSFAGISMNNSWEISNNSQLNFGGSFGLNYNRSKYIEFNWIFHPGSPQEKTRFLSSFNTNYQLTINQFHFSVGAGYGKRAPSVSEGYGYYIYNSFDRYDYIGNPNLKNEISYEGNASIGFKNKKLSIQTKFNYFYIKNYIIGKIMSLGSPMNYQSVGVKIYKSIDYTTLLNFSLNTSYEITNGLYWNGVLTYARAMDNNQNNLPFIRPLSYQTSLHYMYKQFGVQTSVNGDFKQIHFSPEYGENKKPAYTIWNFSTYYRIKFKRVNTTIQVGIENIFDEYYRTYADWGNIPRMGCNYFTSLKINF